MKDKHIISLYWERNERAIAATDEKYGRYLLKISYNILSDIEDGHECVNDTYLKAWSTIPPHRPNILSAYLGKITRDLSIDLFRMRNRQKRGGTQYTLSLDELSECVSGNDPTEAVVDHLLLAEAINRFLRSLSAEQRTIFIGRYYYMDSIRDIASYYGMTEAKIKMSLHRTRIRLKQYLNKEGFEL